MQHSFFIAALISIFLNVSCKPVNDTTPIGDKVSGPADIAVSDDGKYFYVLNIDFDRSHDTGSILVIDSEGEKQHVVDVPRMGRNLTVAGTDMIALFDKGDDDAKSEVRLYDLTDDPKKPELVRTWSGGEDLDCVPINAVLVKGYQHFAVTCRGGKLFIGTLKSDRSKSEMHLVRDYGRLKTRRAMYIDVKRELLFSFVTDVTEQQGFDLEEKDIYSYSNVTGKRSDGANEIPDVFESEEFERRNSKVKRQRYQFTIFDIGAERAEDFPYRELTNDDDNPVAKELRWLYFTLKNFDGTPDTESGFSDLERKLYRTNFWDARPDPLDDNSFYVSDRGRNEGASKYANNVIKVTITADPQQLDEDGKPLPTSEYLSFSRVYGFNNESDANYHFPGKFQIVNIQGRQTLIVNHFKDLVNFRTKQRFSIAAKSLDDGLPWFQELSSNNPDKSFYQFAANNDGRLLVCSFYGNAVIPLEVSPGAGITEGWGNLKRIE